MTEETFNDDVVYRSRTTPVIVDLWAEWCGPCKQLSPVLEKLANEANGAWVLAKVDVDANPRLAQAFQAQSIPMVVAIIGGQMVDAFLGAMPEAQVKQWLTQVLSVADQLGVQTGAAPAKRGRRGRRRPAARARGGQGRDGGGRPRRGRPGAGEGAGRRPADALAKSWLAQVNLIRRASSYDPATVSREAAASPGDIDAQLRMADVQMASGDAEEAFDRVLGVIKRTSGEERNTARLHLLDLFEILPPNDDRVKKARTQLTLLLF